MADYLQNRSFPIAGLMAVEMSVPDLAVARAFYTDVWGLSVAEDRDGALFLRAGGDAPYVLGLTEGPAAARTVIWEAAPDTDLVDLHTRVAVAGAQDLSGIGRSSRPGGGQAFSFRDPAGRGLTIVQGAPRATPAPGPSLPARLAHVNINTADMERDVAFYVEGLGFERTDRSKMMSFLRTNDDHHAIVWADAEVDTLNHIAFLHDGWEDVMTASGRMCDAGHAIGWGPGRHGPGDNVFVYFVDPFGIVIEHTAEVLEVDETYRIGGPEDWVWPKGRTDQWGIAPPKTEACKAAQLAIPFS